MQRATRNLFRQPFLYEETMPLRRRENDSFASPSRRRRYKSSHDNSNTKWIPYLFKAVLLSPLLVVVLWTTLLFSKTNKSQMVASKANALQTTAKSTTNTLIVQPSNLQQQQPLYGAPQQANVYYNFPEQQAGQQQQQPAEALLLPPQGAVSQEQGSLLQHQQYYNFPQQQQQQAAVRSALEHPIAIMQQQQVLPNQPMVLSKQGLPMMPAAQATQSQQQPLNDNINHSVPDPTAAVPQAAAPLVTSSSIQEPALFGHHHHHPHPSSDDSRDRPDRPDDHPHHENRYVVYGQAAPPQTKNNEIKVLYYDPVQTKRDAFGNLYLPDTVFDESGAAVPLQNVRAQHILVEPPSASAIPPLDNAAIPPDNVTVADPKTTLSIPTTASWGQNTTTDSSIIVATVGVMALLVGAVSARRLRTRSILSACIENESLVQEAQFDDSVTNHAYHTFGNNNLWKGDLEKFDV